MRMKNYFHINGFALSLVWGNLEIVYYDAKPKKYFPHSLQYNITFIIKK